MTLFRPGLLDGQIVALSGSRSPAIEGALTGLSARVVMLEDALEDAAAEEWARGQAPLHVLLHDARGTFGDGGVDAMRAAVDRAWAAVRAVAVGAQIPAGRGRIVLLSPPAGAGPFAEPARDALENLARTLSIEWARYSITATAIAPGAETTEEQLAALASFLTSAAGDYLSGCRFSLGRA